MGTEQRSRPAEARGVTTLRPGDEVFGIGEGCFAEYAPARADVLAPTPNNPTAEQAAAVPISGITACRPLMLSPFVGQKLVGLLSSENARDLAVLTELIESGKVTPEVIDRTYPLSETPQPSST